VAVVIEDRVKGEKKVRENVDVLDKSSMSPASTSPCACHPDSGDRIETAGSYLGVSTM
jgi:hypothetical protein